MSKRSVPKYSHHKPSGQARVRVDGKDIYLGVYGSEESHKRYSEVLAEWSRGNTHLIKDLKIRELTKLYIEHCKVYYRKNGEMTGEVTNVKAAIKYLNQRFRNMLAKDFDSLKLEVVREQMIEAGLARTTINNNVSKLKTMFKWAANKKMIDKMVYLDVSTLAGLKAGRSMARETDPVQPVPGQFVEALKDHVTSPVWAMIQVQLLTGMRPGEVLQMRACDISTTGKVWEYRPASHKTQHRKKKRVIPLGGRTQEIIKPFLKTDLRGYLFNPEHGRAEFVEKTFQEGSGVAVRNHRTRYSTPGYNRAITRACGAAGVPRWSPNQLRHNFATKVRKEHGIEVARVLLGHSSAVTSEIYAEVDQDAARAVVAKIG